MPVKTPREERLEYLLRQSVGYMKQARYTPEIDKFIDKIKEELDK